MVECIYFELIRIYIVFSFSRFNIYALYGEGMMIFINGSMKFSVVGIEINSLALRY